MGREEGSGWGTQVCLWWIHFDIWQNQYNIVKFKNKIKLKINKYTIILQKKNCVFTFFNIRDFRNVKYMQGAFGIHGNGKLFGLLQLFILASLSKFRN